MEKIEKYRKLAKIVQYCGMIIIVLVGMFLLYWLGFKNVTENSSMTTLSILLATIMALFLFLTAVGAPMQSKLLKLIILESLNGLVSEVKFNRKKGYSKESFLKLNLVNDNFAQYGCTDYYSFVYKDQLIESTTVRAFDEIKIAKQKGKKGSKTIRKTINHFFGRIYIIPYASESKYNIYGKKIPDISRKKELSEKEYNIELPLKFKKYNENFEVFYKNEKPTNNILSLLDKLYVLRLQAKGPVSLFVRKNTMVLCIDNAHHYAEVEIKNPIDETMVKNYRKDVSMVLAFINAIHKIEE